MITTVFLGKFFGIVFVLFSLGILFNKDHATKIIGDVSKHPGIQTVVGLIPLLLGVWVVLVHNHWSGWQIVVTLVGWLMLLVGVFRLWCVDSWVKMLDKYQHCAPRCGGIIMFIIGLLLLYVGFSGA